MNARVLFGVVQFSKLDDGLPNAMADAPHSSRYHADLGLLASGPCGLPHAPCAERPSASGGHRHLRLSDLALRRQASAAGWHSAPSGVLRAPSGPGRRRSSSLRTSRLRFAASHLSSTTSALASASVSLAYFATVLVSSAALASFAARSRFGFLLDQAEALLKDLLLVRRTRDHV